MAVLVYHWLFSIARKLVVGSVNLTSINEVFLGEEVEIIGDFAFYGCTGLTYLSIPNSVTSFGEYAFSGCTNLTFINSLIENPFMIVGKHTDDRTFDFDIFNNATLYVPKGTIEQYRATEGWRDFEHIVEMDETDGIRNNNRETITDNRYFNLNGQRIEGQPTKKDVYIKNGKKVLMK